MRLPHIKTSSASHRRKAPLATLVRKPPSGATAAPMVSSDPPRPPCTPPEGTFCPSWRTPTSCPPDPSPSHLAATCHQRLPRPHTRTPSTPTGRTGATPSRSGCCAAKRPPSKPPGFPGIARAAARTRRVADGGRRNPLKVYLGCAAACAPSVPHTHTHTLALLISTLNERTARWDARRQLSPTRRNQPPSRCRRCKSGMDLRPAPPPSYSTRDAAPPSPSPPSALSAAVRRTLLQSRHYLQYPAARQARFAVRRCQQCRCQQCLLGHHWHAARGFSQLARTLGRSIVLPPDPKPLTPKP